MKSQTFCSSYRYDFEVRAPQGQQPGPRSSHQPTQQSAPRSTPVVQSTTKATTTGKKTMSILETFLPAEHRKYSHFPSQILMESSSPFFKIPEHPQTAWSVVYFSVSAKFSISDAVSCASTKLQPNSRVLLRCFKLNPPNQGKVLKRGNALLGSHMMTG